MIAPMLFNVVRHLYEVLSHHRKKEADPEAANRGNCEKQEAIKLYQIFSCDTLTAPNTMMVHATNADITHTAMVDLFSILRFNNPTFHTNFFLLVI